MLAPDREQRQPKGLSPFGFDGRSLWLISTACSISPANEENYAQRASKWVLRVAHWRLPAAMARRRPTSWVDVHLRDGTLLGCCAVAHEWGMDRQWAGAHPPDPSASPHAASRIGPCVLRCRASLPWPCGRPVGVGFSAVPRWLPSHPLHAASSSPQLPAALLCVLAMPWC